MLAVIVTSTSFFDFSFLKLEFLVLRIIVGNYKKTQQFYNNPCKKAYIRICLIFNVLCNIMFLKKYYPIGNFEKYGVENSISCPIVSIWTNGYCEIDYN